MTPDTLILLQAQRPTWLVWIGAGLALLTGIVLLVYFISRVRRSEKQADEEWDRAGGLLDSAGQTDQHTKPRLKETRPVAAPDLQKPPISPETFDRSPESRVATETTPHRDEPALPIAETTRPEEIQHEEVYHQETHPREIEHEEVYHQETHPREIEPEETFHGEIHPEEWASSPAAPDAPAPAFEPEPPTEPILGDEVWAELDAGDVTGRPEAPEREAVVSPPRASVERFEPPTVEVRAPGRERYEPPTIMPIVPRQGGGAPERTRKTVTAQRVPVQQASRATLASSTLGLPAEPARGPLTVQSASRVRGAQGINTLSNYGQLPEDESKSHAATITLVITVLVVAGAFLAYLYVPGFHAWVDNLKMKARGASAEPVATSNQPKVKVLPQRPVVEKNQVKAWGYVFNNTADEVLYSISVELGLMKPDGSIEPVVVPVKPDELQPGPPGFSNRPVFEHSYDGKKYTGYKLLRVLSNGAEVPYVAANQGP